MLRKVKSLDWYNANKDEHGDVSIFTKLMVYLCGTEIDVVDGINGKVMTYHDSAMGRTWNIREYMLEPLEKEQKQEQIDVHKVVYTSDLIRIYNREQAMRLYDACLRQKGGISSDYPFRIASYKNNNEITNSIGSDMMQPIHFSWRNLDLVYPGELDPHGKGLKILDYDDVVIKEQQADTTEQKPPIEQEQPQIDLTNPYESEKETPMQEKPIEPAENTLPEPKTTDFIKEMAVDVKAIDEDKKELPKSFSFIKEIDKERKESPKPPRSKSIENINELLARNERLTNDLKIMDEIRLLQYRMDELKGQLSKPEELILNSNHFLSESIKIQKERGKTYDNPTGERSMGKAVEAFNIITGQNLTEAEGWLLLQVLKDVRQWSNSDFHYDSALDCTSYSALKAEALARGGK